jgi:CRP-like cAMP-binding protein
LFANLLKDSRLYNIFADLDFFSVVDKNHLYADLDHALEAAEELILTQLERPEPLQQVYQLQDFSMFNTMTVKEIQSLEKYFIQRSCHSDTLLFERSDNSDGLYLISKGQCEVFINIGQGQRKIRLKTLDAGAFLGEMSLIEATPRSATVQCIRNGAILQLTQERFQALSTEHPTLVIHLLSGMISILSQRLQNSTDKIQDLSQ